MFGRPHRGQSQEAATVRGQWRNNAEGVASKDISVLESTKTWPPRAKKVRFFFKKNFFSSTNWRTGCVPC